MRSWRSLVLFSVVGGCCISQVAADAVLVAKATDPTDDWLGSDPLQGDLVAAEAVVHDNGDIVLSVTYAPGTFDAASTAPTFLIDVDQNTATGASGLDTADNDADLIGPDYSVSVWPVTDTDFIRVTPFDGSGSPRIAYPGEIVARDDGWDFTINSSWIGNDDGRFRFAVLTQRQLQPLLFTGIADYLTDIGVAKPQTSTGIVSAVLPNGRSVEIQRAATVFGTAINTGPVTAEGCFISLRSATDVAFSYQTADAQTNQVTGVPDTPVDIPAGGSQSFVLSLTPNSTFAPQEVEFDFECSNYPPAAAVSGVNTMTLSSSDVPVPDVIALASTPSNDGLVSLANTEEFGVFAIATANVGSAATMSVSVSTGAVELPLDALICQTNPTDGTCINPSSPTSEPLVVDMAADDQLTFSVFAKARSAIAFAPERNRVVVEFSDSGGVLRGATAVAIRADAGPELTLDFDSDTPGSLNDASGRGTGFVTRLSGTGSALAANDSNLELDTDAGVLRVYSTPSNLNGQSNLPEGQFPGISLSTLGFTGAEDFSVTATFRNIQYSEPVDQFGVYVGVDSRTAMRAGYLHFGGSDARLFAVHTIGGLDVNLASFVGPRAGTDLEIVITRTDGIFSVQLGGSQIPFEQPDFLNDFSDLTVGVFAGNPVNTNSKTGTVDDFSVIVVPD